MCLAFLMADMFKGPLKGSPKFHSHPLIFCAGTTLLVSVNCAKGSSKQTSGKIKPAPGKGLIKILRLNIVLIQPLSLVTTKVTE